MDAQRKKTTVVAPLTKLLQTDAMWWQQTPFGGQDAVETSCGAWSTRSSMKR